MMAETPAIVLAFFTEYILGPFGSLTNLQYNVPSDAFYLGQWHSLLLSYKVYKYRLQHTEKFWDNATKKSFKMQVQFQN